MGCGFLELHFHPPSLTLPGAFVTSLTYNDMNNFRSRNNYGMAVVDRDVKLELGVKVKKSRKIRALEVE